MDSVQFSFHVNQSVKVKQVGVNGMVTGLYKNNRGLMYRVLYWRDGIRNELFMYGWELDAEVSPNSICPKE